MAYKLLLADDSQTIQKVVEIVLSPEGFEILAFNNGEDAVKALESVMPDIVLADIEMPKLNGYKLCEHIKGNAATLHIPVVLLAGAFEPFDEDYAKSVGADEFILKPFESHELISKVKSLVMRHETFEIPVQTAHEGLTAGKSEMPKEEPIAAAQESQWGESVPFDWEKESELIPEKVVKATPAGEPKTFDEELIQSLEAIEEESKEEHAAPEELSPDEISIEEISKMVKEAMGEPISEIGTEPLVARTEVTHAGISEMMHEDIDQIMRDSVQSQAGALKGAVEFAVRDKIGEMLPSIIRESVERTVADTVPNLLEEALRESLKEISASLHTAINDELRKVLPGLAETIIKREIEKITSELT
jgi:CheY-like chemotaxis protein